MRPKGAPCADGMGGGQQSRPSAARPAPSPPALAAVPSSVGVVAPVLGRGVKVWQLPRPLAASAPSVWAAWPLAALSRASA